MATVKSITQFSEVPWSDGLVKRRYEVVLTDNFAVDHSFVVGPVKVLPSDDGSVFAADMLQSMKDGELSNQDIVPAWNDTQADYDRRSLGRANVIRDVDDFISYLPLYQAMTARSGNNDGQRAATLGVSAENYNQMASRFNTAVGIQGGIATMNADVFETLPEEFE